MDSITSITYIQSLESKARIVFAEKVKQDLSNTKTGPVIRRENGNYVIVRNDAYEIRGVGGSIRYPVKSPLYTFEDKDQDLWIGSLGEGVFLFRNNKKINNYENYLPGTWVSCILEDHEGGYWFTTLNNCVYYLSNKEVYCLKMPSTEFEEKVNSIVSDGDSLVFWGTAKGNLFQFNERTGKIIKRTG